MSHKQVPLMASTLIFVGLLTSCGFLSPELGMYSEQGGLDSNQDAYISGESDVEESVSVDESVPLNKSDMTLQRRHAAVFYAELPKIYHGEEYLENSEEIYKNWGSDIHAQEIEAAKEIYTDIFPSYMNMMRVFLYSDEGENQLFSPVAAYYPLAVLACCSEGDTQRELLSALNVENIDLAKAYAERIRLMANYRVDDDRIGHFSSILGTLVVGRREIYSEDLHELKTLRDVFGVSSITGWKDSSELDSIIQEWTVSQLQEEVPIVIDETADWSMISALHFEAGWIHSVPQDSSEEGVFTGSRGEEVCLMMGFLETSSLYRGDSFQAVTKPLQDGSVVWFVLPEDGSDTNEVLVSEDLAQMLLKRENFNDVEACHVILRVPRLSMEKSLDMRKGMMTMGVETAFSDDLAQFPGMGEEMSTYLGQIQQELRFDMNEEGVSVHAVNSLVGFSKGETIRMDLDRPFLLFVQMPDGTICFGANVMHM